MKLKTYTFIVYIFFNIGCYASSDNRKCKNIASSSATSCVTGSLAYGTATQGVHAAFAESILSDNPPQALCMWMEIPKKEMAQAAGVVFEKTLLPMIRQKLNAPSDADHSSEAYKQNRKMLQTAWLASLAHYCEQEKVNKNKFSSYRVGFIHLASMSIGRFLFAYESFSNHCKNVNDIDSSGAEYDNLANRIDHLPIACGQKYAMHRALKYITPWDEVSEKTTDQLVDAISRQYLETNNETYAIKGILAINAELWRNFVSAHTPEEKTESSTCCMIQ